MGTIEEEDNLDFEYYVLNEMQLIKFKNDSDNLDFLFGEGEASAYPFDWRVRSNKKWYLLITIYAKKATRTVTVRLHYE